MDWRKPIDEQKPLVAPGAPCRPHRTAPEAPADDLRRAGRDPQMLELAFQARAYAERLRREGRRL